MCFDCGLPDCLLTPSAAPAEMKALAREIEMDLPGEPVPDDVWTAFFAEPQADIPVRYRARLARCWDGVMAIAAYDLPDTRK